MRRKLFYDCINCSIIENIKSKNILTHDCQEVVNFQFEQGFRKNFQVPEPWCGDILNAPILFVSSNPAFSPVELFPTNDWPKEMIADFFINRFADRGEKYSWVYKFRPLNRNGREVRYARYWASIRKRAGELLGREAVPGEDYCLTELVHCKSNQEIGVFEATSECTNKYLERIISISGSKVIIGLGKHVENYFNGRKSIQGKPIYLLPHPNSFQPKTFLKVYGEDVIKKIRKLVNADNKVKISYPSLGITLPTIEEVQIFIESIG